MNITGITLLTPKEYKNFYKGYNPDNTNRDKVDIIPFTDNEMWWLRTNPEETYWFHACAVDTYGAVRHVRMDKPIGVRPVILTEEKPLTIGEKLHIFNFSWTAISENRLLCDAIIAHLPYAEKKNDYKDYHKSNIKLFLNNWLSSQ